MNKEIRIKSSRLKNSCVKKKMVRLKAIMFIYIKDSMINDRNFSNFRIIDFSCFIE